MRYFLVLISLLIIGISAYSQAPGYLGKRFIVGAGPSLKISYNIYDEEIEDVYKIPELTFTYVISKRRSIGLRLNYFKSTISGKTYNMTNNTTFKLSKFNTKTIGIGVDLKRYKHDFVAPIGAYLSTTAAIYYTKPDTFMGASQDVFISRYGLSNFNDIKQSSFAYYLGFGFGKKFVLYKFLGLDISFNMGLIFNDYYFRNSVFNDFFDFDDRNIVTLYESIDEDYQFAAVQNIINKMSWSIKIRMELFL